MPPFSRGYVRVVWKRSPDRDLSSGALTLMRRRGQFFLMTAGVPPARSIKAFRVGAPWRKNNHDDNKPGRSSHRQRRCDLNGHGGTLNMHYSEFAAEVLRGLGHSVEVTTVDRDFDPAEEAAKVVEADAIIMQFAGWWMGQPWQGRWRDLVFTRPEIAWRRTLRTRPHRALRHGAGATRRRPTCSRAPGTHRSRPSTSPCSSSKPKASTACSFPMHKTFEFLGMKAAPSFIANDVPQEPDHRGRPRALQGAPHPLLRMILQGAYALENARDGDRPRGPLPFCLSASELRAAY